MKNTAYFVVILVTASAFGFIFKGKGNQKFATVKIGTQIWMKENLNVDHYRNGDLIPQVMDSRLWDKLKTGAWCYYQNDKANGKKYGKLYNWYAVNDPRGLAPKGWHIPTLKEFYKLKAEVNADGNKLKSVGEGDGKGAGNNKSGFSALLAGGRYFKGIFSSFGYTANFWTDTKVSPNIANFIGLTYASKVFNKDQSYMYVGYSIRCIKN